MPKKFYITTAIVYVNAKPHIGHAYEFITTDTIARYHRLIGDDVFFLTGSDEHSANVLRAAEARGMDAQPFCDEMVATYQDFAHSLSMSYDNFVRTTAENHHKTCEAIITRVHERGDIRKGKYEGWYCESCEAFYTDKDLVDGKCPTHHKEPRWLEEENYFFALSEYQERLEKLYAERPEFAEPEVRRNELLSVIRSGLIDFSTSRSTFEWGIPIPFDPGQVIYVWFDALINYLSGIGYADDREKFEHYWPADVHTIGKDIIRFHCIYWPAMLMSAGLPVPRKVFAHGFVNDNQGRKMSKSLGNVVEPLEQIKKYGTDVLRYFLMREAPYGSDLRYSEKALVNRYNAELANDLGNLLGRSLAMVRKYRDCAVPARWTGDSCPVAAIPGFREKMAESFRKYTSEMDNLALQSALMATWDLIRAGNKFVDESEPWALSKDPARKAELDAVLAELVYALEAAALLVLPFMPGAGERMLEQLGRTQGEIRWEEGGIVSDPRRDDQKVNPGPSLFPRIE